MLLLDSHVALWLIRDNPRLGARARRTIEDVAVVHISAATVLELTIKAMLGKLSIPENLSGRLADQGVVTLPVTAEHAEGIRHFPELVRHDPFDRLIVSQAALTGMRLLTADHVILGLNRDFVQDATI